MVGEIDLRGAFVMLVLSGCLIVGLVWVVWELMDDESIKSSELIEPEIELVVKENKVDTLYVYRKP